jgi:hypothetical protein
VNRAPHGWEKFFRRSHAASSHENIGPGRVRAESLDQPRKSIAPGSTAALAVNADDVQGELAKRT